MIESLKEKELYIKNNIKNEIEILSKKFKNISLLFSKLSDYFNQNNNNDNNVIHLNDKDSFDESNFIEIFSDSSEKFIQRKTRRKIIHKVNNNKGKKTIRKHIKRS